MFLPGSSCAFNFFRPRIRIPLETLAMAKMPAWQPGSLLPEFFRFPAESFDARLSPMVQDMSDWVCLVSIGSSS